MLVFSSRRRHTRYWRDWSSDVCSSDLEVQLSNARSGYQMLVHRVSSSAAREAALAWETAALPWFQGDDAGTAAAEAEARSEARRVGKECRPRRSPYH